MSTALASDCAVALLDVGMSGCAFLTTYAFFLKTVTIDFTQVVQDTASTNQSRHRVSRYVQPFK